MKIAVMGYGTVGRGVVEIIESSVPSLEVSRILELPDRLTDERMTSNFDDIVSDPEVECVVEGLGQLVAIDDIYVRHVADAITQL